MRCRNIFAGLLALAASGLARADDAQHGSDVVVYSGTPCGIAAAIMAAREGAEVLLIEPTRHVGGLSTSGINTAETEHMLKWTLGGFAGEFYGRVGAHYKSAKPAYYFESGVAEKVYLEMLREAGVKVRYGVAVSSVAKEEGAIRSLALTDGSRVSGKVFVDASYEGDLMARAGVSCVFGREGRAEFGEEAAGIRFDRETRKSPTVDQKGDLLPGISGWKKDFKEGDAHPGVMNYNFRLTVTRDPAKRVPFPKPKHYDPSRYQLLANWLRHGAEEAKPERVGHLIGMYGRRNGKFEMNNKQAAVISLGHFGGQFGWPDAGYEERAAIYDDHLEYTLGLLHFLATEEVVPESVRDDIGKLGLHADEFADNGNLPYQLYVREGRRMRGRYVVRQQDVQTERRKEDSIGISSHFIDSHHVQRLAVSPAEFVNEGRIWRMGYAYQIPYRALTPKAGECSNLIVPGAASYTHVAYCTLRLESVWMITGHSAGVAAAMAAELNAPVQNLPVGRLQAKLREQQQVIDFIPGKPEKCERLNGPPEF
ncbi:MAG: FAD-dependent oxidoreductase [Akkermansiaceae bacterium]|nr:FAD-dependent oxidoreductase [Akkermansiaceae bacterium]NNM29787.1 FAD-dependent oxidoreductase [Akkermansiaceae bacterium]